MPTGTKETAKEAKTVAKAEEVSFEEDVTTILSHLLQPSSEETTRAAGDALNRLRADYVKADDEE